MSVAIINYTAANTPGHRYEVCLWYTVHNNNNDKCIINIRIWAKSAKIRRQVFTSPSCTHLKEACYGFAHLMVENSLQHLNCLGPQRERAGGRMCFWKITHYSIVRHLLLYFRMECLYSYPPLSATALTELCSVLLTLIAWEMKLLTPSFCNEITFREVCFEPADLFTFWQLYKTFS